jgi:hypothetical protein
MSLPSTMSSTPLVLQPIFLTSPAPLYVYSIQLPHRTWLIHRVKKITGYLPADDGLKKALTGADIVVIPAGIPRE